MSESEFVLLVFHMFVSLWVGERTTTSQPALINDCRATDAFPSSWDRPAVGSVVGSTGWTRMASFGPNAEPIRAFLTQRMDDVTPAEVAWHRLAALVAPMGGL